MPYLHVFLVSFPNILGKTDTPRVTAPPPTMNLLNNMENSRTEKSVDLFPHYAPAGEDTTNEASSRFVAFLRLSLAR